MGRGVHRKAGEIGQCQPSRSSVSLSGLACDDSTRGRPQLSMAHLPAPASALSPSISSGRAQAEHWMARLARATHSARTAASSSWPWAPGAATSAASASASSAWRSTGCSWDSWRLAFQASSEAACRRTSGGAAPAAPLSTPSAAVQAAGSRRKAASQPSARARSAGSVPGDASRLAQRTNSSMLLFKRLSELMSAAPATACAEAACCQA